MAAIKLVLSDGRYAFEPGERIEGRAAWHFDSAPTAVELRLMWRTVGKGTTDVGVVESIPLQGQGDWGDAPFAITAPEAPWSCSGTLVSVQWTLELVAEPSDEHDSLDIVIAPGAAPVRTNAVDYGEAEPDTPSGDGPDGGGE